MLGQCVSGIGCNDVSVIGAACNISRVDYEYMYDVCMYVCARSVKCDMLTC